MSQYITLLGSEQVQTAASQMTRAAEQMSSAASSIESSLVAHQRFLDDWLYRLEDVMKAAKP